MKRIDIILQLWYNKNYQQLAETTCIGEITMDKTTRAIEMLRLMEQNGYNLQDVIDMLCQYKATEQKPAGQKEESPLEVRISQLLIQLGIPASLLGYHYCRDAISIMYKQEECSITKDVYRLVAEKWNTTPARVERGIRNAIEVCFDRGNTEKLEQYFGYSLSPKKGKATNSEFIAMIADKLRLELKSA